MIKDFCKKIKFKKIKMVILVFLWHFATSTHCNYKFWRNWPTLMNSSVCCSSAVSVLLPSNYKPPHDNITGPACHCLLGIFVFSWHFNVNISWISVDVIKSTLSQLLGIKLLLEFRFFSLKFIPVHDRYLVTKIFVKQITLLFILRLSSLSVTKYCKWDKDW